MEFNQYLTEYYKQLADTWGIAQKKTNLKVPDVPQDVEQIEAFKRIWIDIFDNDFTELFDSKSFKKDVLFVPGNHEINRKNFNTENCLFDNYKNECDLSKPYKEYGINVA